MPRKPVFAITRLHGALSSAIRSIRSIRSLHLSSCTAASQLVATMPRKLPKASMRALYKGRLDRAIHVPMFRYGQDHVLSTPVPRTGKLRRCVHGTAYVKLVVYNYATEAFRLGRGKGQVEAGRDLSHDSQFKMTSCDGQR